MNLNIKSIFLLLGLLGVAQVNAMTPEDVQARKKRVEGRLGQSGSDSAGATRAAEQSEALSVLAKRDRTAQDDEPDRKKAKHEEEKNEIPVAIQPADPNQKCEFAELPGEVLSMIAGKLDFSSYASLSKTCRYLDSFLNDEREIQRLIVSEIRARGHTNITGRLCKYFSACMNLSVVELKSLNGHDSSLTSVTQLSNGNLASCSYDRTIKIWNPTSGECLRTLQGHTDWVTSVIELRNGNLASGSVDSEIRIWNSDSGDCLRSLEGHTGVVVSVIELSNGNLASCSHDRTIKIWNPTSGECLRTLEGHTDRVTSVIELSNGNLASCSKNGIINIWNPEDGECLCRLKVDDWISSMIELSNGNLASGSEYGMVKIWNLDSGKHLRTVGLHNNRVESVIKLSNGNLASGSADRTIKLWNPDGGECLSTLQGHTGVVESVIELSDGNLASCSWDETIKIWNLYPQDLSAQQIYLVLRLERCAGHNGIIKLDDSWAEIFKSLPDYLKERYQGIIL